MDGDYIPLFTDELRLAFCQVTNTLCADVQRIIWKKLLYEELPPVPLAPKKCSVTYSRTSTNSLPRNLFAEKQLP